MSDAEGPASMEVPKSIVILDITDRNARPSEIRLNGEGFDRKVGYMGNGTIQILGESEKDMIHGEYERTDQGIVISYTPRPYSSKS